MWLQQLFPLLINLFFHLVALVKTDTFLQCAILVLILLIPNAIAEEKTAKFHLDFSWRKESSQMITSFFLGYGTHLKVHIDFRCNVFLILQDWAKECYAEEYSSGKPLFLPDLCIYIYISIYMLKQDGNREKVVYQINNKCCNTNFSVQ